MRTLAQSAGRYLAEHYARGSNLPFAIFLLWKKMVQNVVSCLNWRHDVMGAEWQLL
jgi:hypothetical protein